VRRLKLAPNDRRVIRVVYVSIPLLHLEAVEQAYTRLDESGRYLYEGLFRRFRAELETDAEGLY
jgi:hypothetical protein